MDGRLLGTPSDAGMSIDTEAPKRQVDNLLLPLVAAKPRVLSEIEHLPAEQPTPVGTKSYY